MQGVYFEWEEMLFWVCRFEIDCKFLQKKYCDWSFFLLPLFSSIQEKNYLDVFLKVSRKLKSLIWFSSKWKSSVFPTRLLSSNIYRKFHLYCNLKQLSEIGNYINFAVDWLSKTRSGISVLFVWACAMLERSFGPLTNVCIIGIL